MPEAPIIKLFPAQRVDSLDYLRGLAAFGIMVYHMWLFNYGEVDSSSFFAKIKIYGVTVFYILSGITLYMVYSNKLKLTRSDLTIFYIKRFFRIVPLLWLASFLTLLVHYNFKNISFNKLFVNITVLPSVIRPSSLFANGAWSIGNEIFFYLIFPFLIYIADINRMYLYVVIVFSFLILSFFAFNILNPSIALGLQWSSYVNPLEQVFYFVMGMGLVALDGNRIAKRKIYIFISIFILIIFYLYPVTGEPIHLVTGYNRLVLSILAVLFCFWIYKTDFDFLPNFIIRILKKLGEISYSLYLIHPIVFYFLLWLSNKFIKFSSLNIIITATIILSVIVSYFNHIYFEKYFIKRGRNLLKKLQYKKQYSFLHLQKKDK